MGFLNRFYFFCFGILLGVILLLFSFQKRKDSLSFNYFPDSRIKNHLIKNKVFFSERSLCKMSCFDLDTCMLDEYISNGNIDFEKSEIRGYSNKTYYLSFSIEERNINKNSYLVFEKNIDFIKLVDVLLAFHSPSNQVETHPANFLCEDCY